MGEKKNKINALLNSVEVKVEVGVELVNITANTLLHKVVNVLMKPSCAHEAVTRTTTL